jgi:threonine dehydrogenase-like Zn-dependent dehydrogenase
MAGEVTSTGVDVTSCRKGDRVAIEPLMPCRTCAHCLDGQYQRCRRLKHIGGPDRAGGFAELINVPEHNVHPLPDSVSFEAAAMAEVYAVAVHALGRLPLQSPEQVCVIGSGPIGLSIAEMASISGAGSVLVLGKPDAALEPVSRLANVQTFNVENGDALEHVREWSGGQGADLVFEAVGGGATINQAIQMVRPGGRVGLVGGQGMASQVALGDVQHNEISLVGCFCYGRRTLRSEFRIAIDLLASGQLNPDPFITHRFPLAEIAQAFTTANGRDQYGSIKVLVCP